MPIKRQALFAPIAALMLLCACGKKEEAHSVSAAEGAHFDCSFAPSQSKIFAALASSAGSASAATSAVATALGLSAVPHSSGMLILTGGSGYIAGTLGSAFILPAVIYTGAGVATAGIAIELLCFPKNHPDSASRLAAAVTELKARTTATSTNAYKIANPVRGKILQITKETGADAIAYARRKSVEVEEAIRAAAR